MVDEASYIVYCTEPGCDAKTSVDSEFTAQGLVDLHEDCNEGHEVEYERADEDDTDAN